MSRREIQLTGKVPLSPATKVFEALARHLGTATPSYPDGEQIGWIRAAVATFSSNPTLEKTQDVPLNPHGTNTMAFYRLKTGLKSKDMTLGPFGIAANAIASYREFKRLKEAGTIAGSTRFQVTIPSAGMIVAQLEVRPQESFPIATAALWREIEEILDAIPAEELVIQLDPANETAYEEYERRPWAFNVPFFDSARLRFQDGVESLGALANRIPADIPVGIHTCSAWHVDAEGDQDNKAIVAIANQYLRAFKRPLRYIHVPIHPGHTKASDFVPFRDLELKPETRLSLGLINMVDGLDGATRRVAAAEKAGVFDFSVAFWCGLGRPGFRYSTHSIVRQANADDIDELLELHMKVAAL